MRGLWTIRRATLTATIIGAYFGFAADALALQKCTTTLDCAQQAAEAASQANAAVAVLRGRVDKLESTLATLSDSLGGGRVLAMAKVSNGKLEYGSPGVTFDQGSGVISFPNPKNLPIVPIVSSRNLAANPNISYITDMHFVKAILGADKVIVWSTVLETGPRNSPPHDFTIVIVGYDSATKQ